MSIAAYPISVDPPSAVVVVGEGRVIMLVVVSVEAVIVLVGVAEGALKVLEVYESTRG